MGNSLFSKISNKTGFRSGLVNNMCKFFVIGFIVSLLAPLVLTQSINVANANPIAPPSPPIIIESNGSINPPTAPINKTENYYTLTENLTDYRLEIQRNNITFDGAGHTMQGKIYSAVSGITIKANNVTIKNTNIRGYDIDGINAKGSHNVIAGNTIAGDIVIVGDYNRVIGNRASGTNIYLGEEINTSSSYNMVVGNTLIQSCVALTANYSTVYLNNFINCTNSFWFYVLSEGNVFDDGSVGNYWNNYKGVDANGDGIGDTPYIARVSADRYQTFNYPLMNPVDIAKVLDPNPPVISVISPQNTTYLNVDVSLTFYDDEPTSWISYSSDGGTNVTIAGNTTLNGLPVGSHNITVYANDTVGNTGASQTVFFTIIQQPSPSSSSTPTLSPSTTQQPTASNSAPTADNNSSLQTNAVWIATAAAVVVIGLITIVVIFKRKNQKPQEYKTT